MRQDPGETVVFALNRAGANLVVLDPTNLGNPVIDTDRDLTGTFALTNSGSTETIYPEAVDARPGESGTFADCEEGETCQLGQTAGQLTQTNSKVVEVETFDPSYRIFQSYLTDCRSSGDRPCPIVNCESADGGTGCEESDPKYQILNLTELFIRSDSTGELEQLIPQDDPATIPGRFRGEKFFPNRTGNAEECKYKASDGYPSTDELPFELTVDVDQFRLNDLGVSISDDPCPVILPAEADTLTREDEVNDRANVIVHNRDSYDTIADDNGETKSAVLIDRSCGSRKGGGYAWSYTSTGLEPADFDARDYLDFANLQLTQLETFRDEKLCSPIEDLDNPASFFQILSSDPGSDDCGLVEREIEQVSEKAETCFAALEKPQQGESRENCGALFAQIGNLVTTVEEEITRPDSTNPDDIPKLKTAYLAEFESRIGAFRFSTEEWLLKVTPNGGIPPVLNFSAAAYSVNEDAGTATITVTRTGGSDGEVSVNYATADGSATEGGDYTASSGTLTWADGDAPDKSFYIPIIVDDVNSESDETVNLALSAPVGATLGKQSTAELTIIEP
jgi:hypothetical protein